jgi:hypothetical protein
MLGRYSIKSFCTTKEIFSKLKNLPTEWEKILPATHLTWIDITRIYRELKKQASKKSMTH